MCGYFVGAVGARCPGAAKISKNCLREYLALWPLFSWQQLFFSTNFTTATPQHPQHHHSSTPWKEVDPENPGTAVNNISTAKRTAPPHPRHRCGAPNTPRHKETKELPTPTALPWCVPNTKKTRGVVLLPEHGLGPIPENQREGRNHPPTRPEPNNNARIAPNHVNPLLTGIKVHRAPTTAGGEKVRPLKRGVVAATNTSRPKSTSWRRPTSHAPSTRRIRIWTTLRCKITSKN